MKQILYLLTIVVFPISFTYSQIQWEYLGLGGEDIEDILILQKNIQVIYAGSRADLGLGSIGGLYISTNFGATWDTIISGATVREIVVHPKDNKTIYLVGGATFGIQGLIKTTDGGSTWFNADSGLFINSETRPFGLSIDPNNPETLYCGTAGFFGGNLYKTTTGGATWYIPTADSIFSRGVVLTEFDPYNSEMLYAGRSGNGKLDRSTDGGVTWEYAGYKNGGGINSLEFGRNSDEIYTSSNWSFDYPAGIFITSDFGVSWINIGEGFNGRINIRDCAVDYNGAERIFITVTG